MHVMGKNFYCIKEKSASEVDILLYGIIGDMWADEPITDRSFVNEFKALEEKYNRINVRINSPGGSVWDGLPIYNSIASSKKDVHTYNDGLAASMGAVILLAAAKGKVHSAKNALTMLHSPSGLVMGNAKDMRETADVLDKISDSIAISISDNTGLDIEDVKAKWMNYQDHWLSAKEAEKMGLLTVEDYESGSDKDVKNMTLHQIMNLYKDMDDPNKASFFAKMKETIMHAFSITNNNNPKKETMDKLTALMAVLAVSGIELTDGKASFSQDELNKINDALAKVNDLQAQLETATQAATAAEQAKTAAEEKLAQSESAHAETKQQFEAFKASDASKETTEAKDKDELASAASNFDNADYNKAADKIV